LHRGFFVTLQKADYSHRADFSSHFLFDPRLFCILEFGFKCRCISNTQITHHGSCNVREEKLGNFE
jgi:hypothetical protein